MLVSEVIDRTIDEYLYPAGENRPSYDKLASGVDASTLTIPTSGRVTNIPSDTVLEIDSELVLVDSVAGATVTAKERGYLESGSSTHASGASVWVDPAFPRIQIFNKVRAIIGMLMPWGLYARKTDTTQTFTMRNTLALPSGGRRILQITVRDPGSQETYSELRRRGVDWIEYTAFTPPKYHLRRGGAEGATMTVVYSADFTLPSTEADDVTSVCGVPDTLAPALSMGIAGLLLQGREVTRVQIENVRRLLASQGVQVGASMNVGQTLLGVFRSQYVLAERARQSELDPTTFEWVRS